MNTPPIIDLNADVGEGCGDDAALIPLVSSCNIACGAHAGDESTMHMAVALALRHGVAIGAHPGYADRTHFGRIVVPLAPHDVFQLISTQLSTLSNHVKSQGGSIRHVKPHGALYNLAAHDAGVAATIAEAVAAFDPRLLLVGLPDSALLSAGQARGLGTLAEGFIDRAYNPDGSLRDRRLPGAIHTDFRQTLTQALALAQHAPIQAFDGTPLHVSVQTLCLHGDAPDAVRVAQSVRKAFSEAQIIVRSFAG